MARMWSILEKVLCALEKKVHSWLAVLWHSLSPLFCGRAQECLGLEVFAGKFSLSFSFFSLSLWLAHFSSLRLSSRHSGPVLTLSNVACASLFSPCLLVVDMSVWATSLLGVVVRRVICGVFFFFFFLLVMLPSEIPKLPTDLPVRGFPDVWTLLLLHHSLPEWVSVPNCLSLFSSFIFCPPSRRQWAAFLGAWCPPPAFRSCKFVEFAQRSNDLLMNLWGRKWSPHPIPPAS